MENVKVNVILKDRNNLLANANISLEVPELGIIVIKGLPIWKSSRYNTRLQANINITPPSIQSRNKYIPLVFFENKEGWFELESLIYSAYLEKKGDLKKDESVDPRDIPF